MIGAACTPMKIDLNILALDPASLTHKCAKRRDACLCLRMVHEVIHQAGNAPHSPGLRTRHQRPCDRRTAESRDELAPPHSSTSWVRGPSLGHPTPDTCVRSTD